MFSKSSIVCAVVLALSASSFATPISKRTTSFNNWGGHSSLSNFDDFCGADNFSGGNNKVTLKDDKHVVCHSQQVEIVQQKLAVIREFVKKIITEQICEVETQTIVLTQHESGMHEFMKDLSRSTGRYVGYDEGISSHIGSIHDNSGELVNNDLGFKGTDVGANYVSPSGNNWDNNSSPSSVGASLSLSRQAGGLN